MSLRRYIIPAIISASVTAAVFLGTELIVRRSRTNTPKPEPITTEVCVGYPWRDPNSSDLRMMNVVVETNGVFIGEERIPFDAFREYLIQHAQDWRPDMVFVYGTMRSRFGRGVEVYDTLRVLNLCGCLQGQVVQAGTRLPAVEIWKDGEPPEMMADAQ